MIAARQLATVAVAMAMLMLVVVATAAARMTQMLTAGQKVSDTHAIT